MPTPYTPANQTEAQLQTRVNAFIKTNGINAITGELFGQFMADLIASTYNKISNVTLVGLNEYDPTRTTPYNATTGECCTFNGRILQCIAGGAQGAFDAAKWKTLVGLESITRANLLTRSAGGQLCAGAIYFITDANIYMHAESAVALNPCVIHEKRLPKYRANYAGPSTPIEIWNSPESTASPGLYMVEGHKVYHKIGGSGDPSEPPSVNTTDWVEVPSYNNSYYKTERFVCYYDIDNNQITSITDQRGNMLMMSLEALTSFGLSDPYLDNLFRWGDPEFQGNVAFNAKTILWASAASYAFNTFSPGSILEPRATCAGSARFTYNEMRNGAIIQDLDLSVRATLSNSVFCAGSSFNHKVFYTDVTMNRCEIGWIWNSVFVLDVDYDGYIAKEGLNNWPATLDVNGKIAANVLNLTDAAHAGVIKLSDSGATPRSVKDFVAFPSLWPVHFESNGAALDLGWDNSTNILFGPTDSGDFLDPTYYQGFAVMDMSPSGKYRLVNCKLM